MEGEKRGGAGRDYVAYVGEFQSGGIRAAVRCARSTPSAAPPGLRSTHAAGKFTFSRSRRSATECRRAEYTGPADVTWKTCVL